MFELLEGARVSIDELMHETAVAVVEQLLVLLAQDLAGAKQRAAALSQGRSGRLRSRNIISAITDRHASSHRPLNAVE